MYRPISRFGVRGRFCIRYSTAAIATILLVYCTLFICIRLSIIQGGVIGNGEDDFRGKESSHLNGDTIYRVFREHEMENEIEGGTGEFYGVSPHGMFSKGQQIINREIEVISTRRVVEHPLKVKYPR